MSYSICDPVIEVLIVTFFLCYQYFQAPVLPGAPCDP
jgi:hypothetical protein